MFVAPTDFQVMAYESKFPTWIIAGLITSIAVIYTVMGYYMPFTGDDLGYGAGFGTYYGGDLEAYPLFAARHWLHVNGRMANLITPFLLFFSPKWLLATLNGIMTALFFAFALKAVGFTRQTVSAQLFLIALIAFTFPWWDSMMLFDVSFNYVWASAFGLGFLLLLFKDTIKRRWAWMAWIFAFLAGAMHEAMSVPIVCGLFCYYYFSGNWRNTPKPKRIMTGAFVLGSAMAFLSIGIWRRFGSDFVPNDPMWLLTLKSDFYAILFLLFIVTARLASPLRLAEMMRRQWVVYAVAAIISMGFSAVGGIVGRSGWFAQIFALIALFQWARECDWRINRKVAALASAWLLVAIVAHYAELTRWQLKTSSELRKAISLYEESPDGTVYMDFTPHDRFPWWVLHKNRGVPDADDSYILQTITQFHGDESRPMRILPSAVEQLDARSVKGDMRIGNGWVSREKPDTDENGIFDRNGQQYVSVPFRKNGIQLYFLTPRYLDPGDR